MRAKPPPVGIPSQLLCLAAATAIAPVVVVLFARCHTPDAMLLVTHVFWGVLDVFVTMLAASWPMARLRAAWNRTDEAMAGKAPRAGYALLSVDGHTFLALAGACGAFAWYHALGGEVRLLTLTAACAATCGILSAANLRNRALVRTAMQKSPSAEPDPSDIPERPVGVAFISVLAIGIGLATAACGYGMIAASLHSWNSIGGGYGIIIGAFLLFFVGLPVVWAGRCAYLLEKGGRDLLVALFSLLCVGPLIPVALPILIYLRRRSVKDMFALRDDTPALTPEEKLRRWETRYWRWLKGRFRR